jgi:hypothetical protein
MQSDWDGQTIKLKKFEGSVRDYARSPSIRTITGLVESIVRSQGCEWKGMPKFLWVIELQNREFNIPNNHYFLPDFERLDSLARRCGQLSAYVEEHGK